jgi:hypothetical protein
LNFTQLELLYSQLSYGLTDNISLQVGSMVPLAFLQGGDGSNIQVALKWGGKAMPGLNLAAGVFAVAFSGGSYGAFLPFITATLGDYDSNVSLNLSPPGAFSQGYSWYGAVICTISGKLRMTKGISLLTENWFAFYDNALSPNPMVSGGVRFSGKEFASDVGLVFSTGFPFPFPWVNFSYTL